MLKIISISLLTISLFTSCKKNHNSMRPKYQLDSNLGEISGMIRIEDKYFAHNDSGSDPIIYEINIEDGTVTREIYISNAINIDWEDIAVDSNYVYIGDIGGNNTDRNSLEIYKVKITDLLTQDIAFSEIISINKETTHPKDFEAMLVKEGNLYLFSKDIDDYICKTYKIDLNEAYSDLGNPIDKMKLSVAITGADYNPTTNEAALIGYSFFDRSNVLNFKINILKISNFQNKELNSNTNIKTYIINNSIEVLQAESITYSSNSSEVFVSSEMNPVLPASRATLFSFLLY
jgi:hypothetical protein